MTSSEDHFRAAEKFLEEAESHREPDTRAEWCLRLAKIHLALSQASQVASPGPSGEKPQNDSLPDHTAPDTTEGQIANPPFTASPTAALRGGSTKRANSAVR